MDSGFEPIPNYPVLKLLLVSFITPTLNEAKNLPHVLPRIPKWAHEVIIVDGRSTDNTIEVALELYPEALIVTEPRRGRGAARAAARAAGFNTATGDVIVMLDADGSMDPSESIVSLGALMAGADLVKGSRTMQRGRKLRPLVLPQPGQLGPDADRALPLPLHL